MDVAEAQVFILRLLKIDRCVRIGYFITDDAHALGNLITNRLAIQISTPPWAVFSQAFWELIARRPIFIGGAQSFNQCSVF